MLEFQFSCVQFLFCFSLQTLRDSLDCMYDARIPTHWKKVYRQKGKEKLQGKIQPGLLLEQAGLKPFFFFMFTYISIKTIL